VTTPSGAWKMLTYPIQVDGTRLTRTYGYQCRYSSRQALIAEEGRYAEPGSSQQPFTSRIEAA